MKTKQIILMMLVCLFVMPTFAQKPKKIKDGYCKFQCSVDDSGYMCGEGFVTIGNFGDLSFKDIKKGQGYYEFKNATYNIEGNCFTAENMIMCKEPEKIGEKGKYSIVIKKGEVTSGAAKGKIIPEYPVKIILINECEGVGSDRKYSEVDGAWFEKVKIDNDIVAAATKSEYMLKNSNELMLVYYGFYGVTENGYKIEKKGDNFTIISPNQKNKLICNNKEIDTRLNINGENFEIAKDKYKDLYNSNVLCVQSGDIENAKPEDLWLFKGTRFRGMIAFKNKNGEYAKRTEAPLSLLYAKLWANLDNYEMVPYSGIVEKSETRGSTGIDFSFENSVKGYASNMEEAQRIDTYYKNGEKIDHDAFIKPFNEEIAKKKEIANQFFRKCVGTWGLNVSNNGISMNVSVKINSNGTYSFDMKLKVVRKLIAPLTGRVYKTEVLTTNLFANNQHVDYDDKNIALSYNVFEVLHKNTAYTVNGIRQYLNDAEVLLMGADFVNLIKGVYTPNSSFTTLTGPMVLKRVTSAARSTGAKRRK